MIDKIIKARVEVDANEKAALNSENILKVRAGRGTCPRVPPVVYCPSISAASFSSSMIGRCCGQTPSHWPQAIQSDAFPLRWIRPE